MAGAGRSGARFGETAEFTHGLDGGEFHLIDIDPVTSFQLRQKIDPVQRREGEVFRETFVRRRSEGRISRQASQNLLESRCPRPRRRRVGRLCGDCGGDEPSLELVGRFGPRKLGLWPNRPKADPLLGFQLLVRSLDEDCRFGLRVVKDERGMSLIPVWAADRHDGAVADTRLGVEDAFDVFRMDVQSIGGHDDVFLASPIGEPPIGVHLAQIASVEPTFIVGGLLEAPTCRQVLAGDARTANQDFPSLARRTS